MNLRSIEYFLITVEEMNFTKAAKRLYISQQALSGHILRLENEYQVQLFNRKPSLSLTLEGEQMVFFGKQMLKSNANMLATFSDINKRYRGVLRIGISRLRGKVFFPLIWKHYNEINPNISIELVDGNSEYLNEFLQTGKIDLYIGVDVQENSTQHRVELAKEKIQCCFSEGLLEQYYPKAWESILLESQNGINLLEINKLPFITLRNNNRLRKSIDIFFSHHFKPQFLIECNEQSLVYDLSKNGYGAGLLSPLIFYQKRYIQKILDKSLYVFPIKNEIPENTVYLVYRKDYKLPKYALDFIQIASMVFDNYSRSVNNL